MENIYRFGYPTHRRIELFEEAKPTGTYPEEYRGKYRDLPIIEVPIESLVYRIENIRTKSLQKEWFTRHPESPKDLFTSDPLSIEAQEAQHQILTGLASDAGLLSAFKDGKLQQKDPIICSDDGIVVNGNRRLCTWRNLYYGDKIKYAHFQSIRVAVLPDHDPQGMYDLEVALQIHSDMKAKYVWHALAADYKERVGNVDDISAFAAKQGKKSDDIRSMIECYDYAAQYLESIGHPNEWSRVNGQDSAFKQIISGRKSIMQPGDKELFQEIVKAMLQIPASGDRLYAQIPKVVKNLETIAPKLQEVFQINLVSKIDDDLAWLTGGDNGNSDNTNSQIAAGVRTANDPETVVNTVKSVLETTEEVEKEKKKKSYIFDQVRKAATCLTNAVTTLDDTMSKVGIEKQLENIEGALVTLKDWIK